MMLTVEEENLLSMYADEDGDLRNTIYNLQEAAALCGDYEIFTLISALITKIEGMTEDEFYRIVENITFTDAED